MYYPIHSINTTSFVVCSINWPQPLCAPPSAKSIEIYWYSQRLVQVDGISIVIYFIIDLINLDKVKYKERLPSGDESVFTVSYK